MPVRNRKGSVQKFFFEEWGTSGRKLPQLSDVLDLLEELKMFRAADYMYINLLNKQPPERSFNYPEEPFLPPTEIALPTAPPLSVSLTPEDFTFPAPTAPPLSLSVNLNASPNNLVPAPPTNLVSTSVKRLDTNEKLIHYSYQELTIGTRGFSSEMEIGHGGFGNVYKCNLKSLNETVAVKRLRLDGIAIKGIDEQQFHTETNTLSSLCHPNVLSLIGYSDDGPYKCILYPFMVNGSLQDRIECKNESTALEWDQRFDIARGTANGILYLHTYSTKPLVHRDIKSANILLDTNLVPKIGDFGLVRQGSAGVTGGTIALTTTVLGTSAYMAPEAIRGDVSVKMDVFSFGVVLLELITGLPPLDEDREGRDLVSHVDEVENIEELIDNKPKLSNVTFAIALHDIAQKCLLEKKLRPNMAQTLELLDSLKV